MAQLTLDLSECELPPALRDLPVCDSPLLSEGIQDPPELPSPALHKSPGKPTNVICSQHPAVVPFHPFLVALALMLNRQIAAHKTIKQHAFKLTVWQCECGAPLEMMRLESAQPCAWCPHCRTVTHRLQVTEGPITKRKVPKSLGNKRRKVAQDGDGVSWAGAPIRIV